MAPSLRPPAVAGQFYPADPTRLRASVGRCLAAATPHALDAPLIGVVAPHAGIMYSGPVAAYAFRALQTERWDAVLLVGGSHHYALHAAHVDATGAWASPLGDFPIAEDLAAELIAADDHIIADRGPHLPEHSLEVLLPFLAETVGRLPIVPILVSPTAPAACAALGRAVGRLAPSRKLAIVASTDLSHYHPYEEAHRADRAAIDAICAWTPDALVRDCGTHAVEACGGGAVAAAEHAAAGRGATHAELLHYATSGDVPEGEKSRVVGYAAIAFTGQGVPPEFAPLTEAEGRRALAYSRAVLEAYCTGGPPPAALPSAPPFTVVQGVFVTLRLRDGTLRGCLGRVEEPLTLADGLRAMTVAAASRDPRFPPVAPDELADLRIEISVLSVPEPLPGPRDLELGRDGLIIAHGDATGLLLPQVAAEQGWTGERFLQAVSRKAGLPENAWTWTDSTLRRFTAQVFADSGTAA